MDYKDFNADWSIIKVKQDKLKPRIDMAAIEITPSTILIFGGYDGDFNGESFIYNTETKNFKPTTQMEEGESFNARKPIIYKDKVYSRIHTNSHFSHLLKGARASAGSSE